MRICAVQTKPVPGDIDKNIEFHKTFITQAAANHADIIIFPELSLTGYEPNLAKEVATTQDDSRCNVFQTLSDTHHITVGVGIPTKQSDKPGISMIIFQPNQDRRTYSKQYLHSDEEAFFCKGPSTKGLAGHQSNIALAICYEISIPEHAEAAYKNGAEIYIASVAKFANGIEQAKTSLSNIAKQYSMIVIMSNCVGMCDGQVCAGQSAVWNPNGKLICQLDDKSEGLLIFDTKTQICF